MRVLFIAAELHPFVKTGGLGDVSAALPAALRAHGIDVRLLLPALPAIRAGMPAAKLVAALPPCFGTHTARVLAAPVPGSDLPAYLVDAPDLYQRAGNPYADPNGHDWPDNHLRFALFGAVAAALAEGEIDRAWRADVAHGHDWHAGLMPAYLAARGARTAASVTTIHNLSFPGLFPAAVFRDLALPAGFFAPEGVEFWGHVSFMKAGLQFCDRITAVSPTYASEICTPEFGCGLDGLLRRRERVLDGILNGIDMTLWDPRCDGTLVNGFGPDELAGKRDCKRALQRAFGLHERGDVPIAGIVSRLTEQKGIDLVVAAAAELLSAGLQLIVLGTGERPIEKALGDLAVAYPGRIGARIGFDEAAAHRIIAGADMVLMPSRFEPCGLTQMYAMRYGTVPIVRRVGGLADTVVDADTPTPAGEPTGFVFERAAPADLVTAARRATARYRDPAAWRTLRRAGMTRDFSWSGAAQRYVEIYCQAMAAVR